MKKIIGVFILSSVLLVGCKKSKIDKNLDGTWILSELTISGFNEVTVNTSHSLEFSNVDKGEGSVRLISTDAQGVYIESGTVSINKDYDHMSITLNDAGWVSNLDGDFTVDESSFSLTGTYSNSSGNSAEPVSVKGFK